MSLSPLKVKTGKQDKLRVLKTKCQELENTLVSYKDIFGRYVQELEWDKEETRKREDKLEDGNGM
ncbi:hypothetical protein CAEBREN_09130 [Caenorhabditis brenneri]|uniref:Uncharacterized protein n=1 Tax=Caenorhabditis brenneri TaxID=135651 RepID=G0PHT3_CAEBE|nr:hypothetical protein CAEBREN_09130 [Caenorhabditis brenneri]